VSKESEIGILCFPVRTKGVQTLRVPLEVMDSVVIGSAPWEEKERGPDLAFLRLPAVTMASIEILASVVNGDLHRQKILEGVPEPTRAFSVVCGVIDEWTGQAFGTETTSTTSFEACWHAGNLFEAGYHDGMDLIRLQPIPVKGTVLPTSYKGTSGGGLWQIFLNPDDFSLVQARLVGVAFREKRVAEEFHIIGHGQRSIYETLFKEITKKWPTDGG
jgi:hypothetical protein